MKSYKVTVEFIDRHTRVYYPVGGVYETDNEERAKELQELGFLEKTTDQIEGKSSEKTTVAKQTKRKKSQAQE